MLKAAEDILGEIIRLDPFHLKDGMIYFLKGDVPGSVVVKHICQGTEYFLYVGDGEHIFKIIEKDK